MNRLQYSECHLIDEYTRGDQHVSHFFILSLNLFRSPAQRHGEAQLTPPAVPLCGTPTSWTNALVVDIKDDG